MSDNVVFVTVTDYTTIHAPSGFVTLPSPPGMNTLPSRPHLSIGENKGGGGGDVVFVTLTDYTTIYPSAPIPTTLLTLPTPQPPRLTDLPSNLPTSSPWGLTYPSPSSWTGTGFPPLPTAFEPPQPAPSAGATENLSSSNMLKSLIMVVFVLIILMYMIAGLVVIFFWIRRECPKCSPIAVSVRKVTGNEDEENIETPEEEAARKAQRKEDKDRAITLMKLQGEGLGTMILSPFGKFRNWFAGKWGTKMMQRVVREGERKKAKRAKLNRTRSMETIDLDEKWPTVSEDTTATQNPFLDPRAAVRESVMVPVPAAAQDPFEVHPIVTDIGLQLHDYTMFGARNPFARNAPETDPGNKTSDNDSDNGDDGHDSDESSEYRQRWEENKGVMNGDGYRDSNGVYYEFGSRRIPLRNRVIPALQPEVGESSTAATRRSPQPQDSTEAAQNVANDLEAQKVHKPEESRKRSGIWAGIFY